MDVRLRNWTVAEIAHHTYLSSSFYDFSIDGHAFETAMVARILAWMLGANEEVCWLGGVLHDIGATLNGQPNHHEIGAQVAEHILENTGYDQETIDAVVYCVLTHRGSIKGERLTIESQIVAAADAISHFKRVVHLLRVKVQRDGLPLEEAKKELGKKFRRDMAKVPIIAKCYAHGWYDKALIELEEITMSQIP